jgi:protease-4
MMAERILVSDLVRNTWLVISDRLRLFRYQRLDYVVLSVSGDYPERTVQPRRRFPLSLIPWPSPPPSVQDFVDALERVAADRRVQGIVLLVSNLTAGPATVSSLLQAIDRFRESGKRSIAYLHDLDMWSYYLAAACEEIWVPESASFRAAGLWSEAIFLRDTLSLIGIEAEFEAFAEYKVSPDRFRRSRMTEPHREMLESLLDSLYDTITAAMAKGRGMSEEQIRGLLDSVPLTAEQAMESGLVDGVCYEDELPILLGATDEPVVLLTWEQAQRRLMHPRRWHSRRAVGFISLEGMIVPGPSRRAPLPVPLPLPLPSTQAGSETVVQQLRAAAQDKRLAAVVLHVDSPGGSALASDLIWREVAHLRHIKPVVVYMSNLAASGGYYVSVPANAILAQPTTLTGSIGIWGGKIVTRGLFEKLRVGREIVSRGKAAGLYADATPFSEEERAKVRADIGAGYTRFKARVAEGRGMTDEQVETIARGRVWTGKQAMAHGLVDELGDLQTAAEKARELARVSKRRYSPLIDIHTPKHYQLPQSLSTEGGKWLAGLAAMLREGVFALAPWIIRIRG